MQVYCNALLCFADGWPLRAAWVLQHCGHSFVQVLCRALPGGTAHAGRRAHQLQALGAGNSHGRFAKLKCLPSLSKDGNLSINMACGMYTHAEPVRH